MANICIKREQMANKENEELLTRKEAAEILRLSYPALKRYTEAGFVKGYKLGSRLRYKRSELEAALITIGKNLN